MQKSVNWTIFKNFLPDFVNITVLDLKMDFYFDYIVSFCFPKAPWKLKEQSKFAALRFKSLLFKFNHWKMLRQKRRIILEVLFSKFPTLKVIQL
jgi:hypothetical protein